MYIEQDPKQQCYGTQTLYVLVRYRVITYMYIHIYIYVCEPRVSMGVVGVKSTAGRAVKCVDPSKTTRSESAWLGYPFCDQ